MYKVLDVEWNRASDNLKIIFYADVILTWEHTKLILKMDKSTKKYMIEMNVKYAK